MNKQKNGQIRIQAVSGIVLLCVLSLCWLCGCGSPYKAVRLNPIELFETKSQNAVNSSQPSWETQQYLRLMFLDKAYKKDPPQAIALLEDGIEKEQTLQLRMALAELSLLEAQKRRDSDPQKKIYYIRAAKHAYDYLFFDTRPEDSSTLSPSFRFMADIYNLAIAELVGMRATLVNPWESTDMDYRGIHYHFEVVKQGAGIWDPSWFDYLHNSYEIRVTGLTNEYTTKGLGAPLVGIVEKPVQDPHFGRFFPPRLVAYPITAVLLFDPIQKGQTPSRNIRLVFYDSLVTESITIQNRQVPLEADYTTPLGLQLRKTNPFQTGLHNLISSDVELKNAGIYMLEPYRPDKIPVLMVHGLMSSPSTWAGIFNDLRGDPQLRKRYQFWFFMYPTGLPIGYSTSLLRDQLNAVRALYDPNGVNPNFNQMVMMGHSMGGLLTRGMVQDSGTTYWDSFFKEPFETINLDPNTKEQIKNIMFFEHQSCVKRVIFVATPHRGSPMADTWYTKLFSGLIEMPVTVSDTTAKMISGGALTESASATYTKKVSNSVLLLSPSSIYTQATNKVPLRSDIPYHSIIGTRKTATSGTGTSDGIVPYESSHLDFTESELLVPSGHSAHEHPLAIDEVKRILREHLAGIPTQNNESQ
ncbi:MAG: alpha/beta hydrolase [Anaerohalosphaeraceae bacterium]